MKKFLKIIGFILGLGIVFLLISIWVVSEPLPKGRPGPDADALAEKMLKALNYEAYQKTRYLEWSFQNGKNHFVWDKELGKVKVSWNDNNVHLNLVAPSKSKALVDNMEVEGKEKEKLIQTATDYFNNDSFWLVAPFKVFDKGTTRSIVPQEDGSEALLITYKSGGTTPGDSYLWLLDPNGFPNSYKMWAKIIPIGGLQASWDDWMTVQSGAFLPKSHELGPITLGMGNVKGYN